MALQETASSMGPIRPTTWRRKQMRPSSSFGLRAVLAALGLLLAMPASLAQQPIKVGIVTFLSGPAAGPFGIPARNAAELTAELLNKGTLPAPYDKKGMGGANLQLVIV